MCIPNILLVGGGGGRERTGRRRIGHRIGTTGRRAGPVDVLPHTIPTSTYPVPFLNPAAPSVKEGDPDGIICTAVNEIRALRGDRRHIPPAPCCVTVRSARTSTQRWEWIRTGMVGTGVLTGIMITTARRRQGIGAWGTSSNVVTLAAGTATSPKTRRSLL